MSLKTEKETIKLLEAVYNDGTVRIESEGHIARVFINDKEIDYCQSIVIVLKKRCLPAMYITKLVMPLTKEID